MLGESEIHDAYENIFNIVFTLVDIFLWPRDDVIEIQVVVLLLPAMAILVGGHVFHFGEPHSQHA